MADVVGALAGPRARVIFMGAWGYPLVHASARTRSKRDRPNHWKQFHSKMARGQRAKVTGAAFLSDRDIDWSGTRAAAMGATAGVHLSARGHRPQAVTWARA